MEIRKYVDSFGDDVFALALIVTKDFSSAKEVFCKTAAEADKFADSAQLLDVVKKAYPLCKEADSNDEAITLTGISLSAKQEALLQTILTKPQIIRALIHLTYENDLDPAQIAKLTGESERYVNGQLAELSEPLQESLEKHYKEICAKIRAEDKLKAYVIGAAERGEQRMFEVKREAVPTHRWNKTQKLIVVIAAVIISLMAVLVIPIVDKYLEMREHEGYESFENVPTEELFSYTMEAESE